MTRSRPVDSGPLKEDAIRQCWPDEDQEFEPIPVAWATPLLALLRQDTLPPLKDALAIPERLLILRALSLCQGNKTAAAGMLGLSRSTLYQKMGKYSLIAEESHSRGA
jgi:DNA-binding NtrC family response regulator